MCGIVGLFIKDKALEPRLGELTAQMLATMCERGPDSAGFAVYAAPDTGKAKLTVQSADADKNFAGLLPCWDWLFGTLYLPRDRAPANFGIHEPMPPGLIGQLRQPFTRDASRTTRDGQKASP